MLASLLIPSLGIFGALKALGVIFFVTIAASALFLKAPEAGWLPEGFEAPKGGAHAGTTSLLFSPKETVSSPYRLEQPRLQSDSTARYTMMRVRIFPTKILATAN